MASATMKSVNFEVFGKVQGVFFRKHTDATARKLGLVGYVQNTPTGTVIGTLQGPTDKVDTMKQWLKETGSPESRIEKCVFSNEKGVDTLTYSTFKIG